MTPLEKELLNEVERLQEQVIEFQTKLINEQNERKKLETENEQLRSNSICEFYKDLENDFYKTKEKILTDYKNELEKSESVLNDLENSQSELNQISINYKHNLEKMDYKQLQSDYEALKIAYKNLETHFNNELARIYQTLTNDMAESLDSGWKARLKELLPIVDLKLNENYENPNDNE